MAGFAFSPATRVRTNALQLMFSRTRAAYGQAKRAALRLLKLTPTACQGRIPIFQLLATIWDRLAHQMSFVRNQDSLSCLGS